MLFEGTALRLDARQSIMGQKSRTYRLQVEMSDDEQRAIDDFWFRERLPNKAAAVRELLLRGAAKAREENSN